jgi:hypothetical protein
MAADVHAVATVANGAGDSAELAGGLQEYDLTRGILALAITRQEELVSGGETGRSPTDDDDPRRLAVLGNHAVDLGHR